MAEKLTRQELYDLVWSVPVKTAAERFSISDVALRKRCQKAEIPLPPLGYWAKLRNGKAVTKPELPARLPGMKDIIDFDRHPYYWQPLPDEELLGPVPPAPVFSEPLDEIRARYLKKIGKVTVQPQLAESVHHLIRRCLDADEARRKAVPKLGYLTSYDKPIFESAFEQRRLRFLNALFLAAGRAGARPSMRDDHAHTMSFAIYDEIITLRVNSEVAIKTGIDRWHRNEAPENTKLQLTTGHGPGGGSETWIDGPNGRLEKRVAEIVAELFVMAERDYRYSRKAERQRRISAKAALLEEIQRAKEKAVQDEIDRQERLRKARVDRLLTDAKAFGQAQAIRKYIAEAQVHVGVGADEGAVASWSAWATAVADDLDPVANGSFVSALSDIG